MSDEERKESGSLTVDHVYHDDRITLMFRGKSIVRDPNEFLMPTMLEALDMADREKKQLVLDFTELSYMNSSTFTPLIKVLEKARLSGNEVQVIYSAEQRWQQVSFSALTIFRTSDGRIDVTSK